MRRTTAVLLAAGAAVAAVAVLSACSSDPSGLSGPAGRSGTSAPAPVTSPSTSDAAAPAAVVPASSTPVASPPAPKPKNYCARNSAAQKVIVNVRKQHAWMCAKHKAVYDTGITTGMVGEWTQTPTGDYQIQGRNMNTVLTLNTGATYNVKYWIPFDAPLFGFHDSSWQHFPYGSAKYKTQGSHGCIHMPLKAMRFLYGWVAQPTDVHIA
jgi:L,D-transpeptidase-like protein